MPENSIIKSITSHSCPHCGGEIYIENQIVPPTVSSLFTPEMVEEAKKDCLTRVQSLTLDEDKKESVKKWIEDPSTVFGPSEVESIILSLLKPEE